jgi:hypothetical protein
MFGLRARGRLLVVVALSLALFGVFTQFGIGAQAHRQANEWAGTWSTDWGTMTLRQSGASVTGNYTHDSGHITGTASGLTLTGRWDEAPTRKGPNDAGSIRWTMKPDLRTFSGTWTYDGGGGGSWVGTRTSAPPTTTTPPTSTTEDTERPTVGSVAWPGVAKPGDRIQLGFTVKDNSGLAKVAISLYDGGGRGRGAVLGPLKADGGRNSWNVTLSRGLKGPLYFCVWAQDAAGNKSAGAPTSDCKWIPLLVPIAKVSNGCGGEGWDSIVAIENYFGNVHTYKDSNKNPLAKSYTVNFKAACDLHDAGYGGQMVADSIRGGTINYRTWSRLAVDKKFWADMKILCDRQIKAQEPRGVTATVARAKCYGVGGSASIGSEWLYNKVRYWGNRFFDADLAKVGTQKAGRPSAKPWGAARLNR